MRSNNLNPSATLTSIIELAPDIPIKKQISVQDVLKEYDIDANHSQNLTKLASLHKFSLIETLSFLDVRHYSKSLDLSKIKSEQNKRVIAAILNNKIRSLLPQQCADCKNQYLVPLHDPTSHSRNYCCLCGQPSHMCEKDSPSLTWICTNCILLHEAPHIPFLQDTPEPSASPLSQPPNTSNNPSSPHHPNPSPSHNPPSSQPPDTTLPHDLSSTPYPRHPPHCNYPTHPHLITQPLLNPTLLSHKTPPQPPSSQHHPHHNP